jgi:aldose 1-epimerase
VGIPVPPSGEQFSFGSGRFEAVAVEVGGGIRSLTADGRAVLDGYPVDEMCSGARGAPLIPWPNRLADGRYTYRGTDYQVALTEVQTHNAIHGFLRWRNWSLRERSENAVELGTVLHPLTGYPFTVDTRVRYELDDAGLAVTTTATNLGGEPCPFGCGQHPYLTAGTEFVDECTLRLEATSWLPTDDRGLPTGTESVQGSPYDFRGGRRIGEQHIDYAFTDLARDDDGRAWVVMSAPDGRTTRLWVDEHYPFVELYSGDTQPPEKRRRGMGMEPMTCAPNGFASGDGLLTLEPGQMFSARWGICID